MSKKGITEIRKKKLEQELKRLKENKKDVAEVQKEIQILIEKNFMSNAEVAAVLTSVMYAVLNKPELRKSLKELGVETEIIGVDETLSIQRMWALEYLKSIKKDTQ